jgi:hypothetical protein
MDIAQIGRHETTDDLTKIFRNFLLTSFSSISRDISAAEAREIRSDLEIPPECAPGIQVTSCASKKKTTTGLKYPVSSGLYGKHRH